MRNVRPRVFLGCKNRQVIGLTVPERIDIAVAVASGLVAMGTLVLAWTTSSMARETKASAAATATEAKEVARQAKAAEEQIQLTRAALNSSVRPWLTRVTPPLSSSLGADKVPSEHEIVVEGQETNFGVRLHLRNVGPGIALIGRDELGGRDEAFRIEGLDLNGERVHRNGFAAAAVLPPNESTLISFVVENAPMTQFLSLDRNDGEFWVSVPYTDVNGGQSVVAKVHVTRLTRAGSWAIHKIDYYDADPSIGDDFIATVEFDAAIRAHSLGSAQPE
jgi:hypothetical protein